MPLSLPHALDATASTPDDIPYFEATWTDRETGARGYLVIDGLVRGVCSGGLRMREGCTLGEIRGLARGMTLKEAIHYDPHDRYVPLGGAKGGIDFDPYHPAADEVLRRYLVAMRPLIEQRWSTGEDFGIQQATVDRLTEQIGLISSVQAIYQVLPDVEAGRQRLSAGQRSTVDGVGLDELVGGAGVAEAAVAALDALGRSRAESRAVVQGFGSMGGATARYLVRAGVRVIGIADVRGTVVNPAGLDVERLLLSRDLSGTIDRTQLGHDDRELASDQWLTIPAEIAIPAAMSYAVDENNQRFLHADVVAEAANMPVTPEAEAALLARGCTVVPDFLANSATNAWWWWVLFGDIDGTPENSLAHVRTRIRSLVTEVLRRGNGADQSPRAAALAIATANLAELHRRFPGDDS